MTAMQQRCQQLLRSLPETDVTIGATEVQQCLQQLHTSRTPLLMVLATVSAEMLRVLAASTEICAALANSLDSNASMSSPSWCDVLPRATFSLGWFTCYAPTYGLRSPHTSSGRSGMLINWARHPACRCRKSRWDTSIVHRMADWRDLAVHERGGGNGFGAKTPL
eukprot:148601-Amphidinium_carterae.1